MTSSSSVILVIGSDPKKFGTGFVVHHDDSYTYVVTCTHVVKDLEDIKVNDEPATLIAFDDSKYGFDLAVLKIKGPIPCSALVPEPRVKPGRSFVSAGFLEQAGQYVRQEFGGTVGKPAGWKSKTFGDGEGWHLTLGAQGRFENGYSGSPVLDEESGHVLGVIAIRSDDASGSRGIAIAISALAQIWPDMPGPLLEVLVPNRSAQTDLPPSPVMNLTAEVATFKAILANQRNQKSRVIVISGESGMGKSYLLHLYRQTAKAAHFDMLDFGLAEQISIQRCLSTIVSRFGSSHFNRYEEYLDSNIIPSDPNASTSWRETLTRHFFKDLSDHEFMAPLVLFFDQYEKADPIFQGWLRHLFLSAITPRMPLIVVVAGQESDSLQFYGHFFRLVGLNKEHFYRYAVECKAPFDKDLIDLFHQTWRGRPKEFSELIGSQSRMADGSK